MLKTETLLVPSMEADSKYAVEKEFVVLRIIL